MDTTIDKEQSLSLGQAENWLALGTGVALFVAGASRRSVTGVCLLASSAPLLYRGVTGRWPAIGGRGLDRDDTRRSLSGDRGLHVRESIRLELPVDEVYRFWRRLENLPQFMSHLER